MTMMDEAALQTRIAEIEAGIDGATLGVHVHDEENGRQFARQPDRVFHAASTMKAAVLLALFRAAEKGALRLEDRLHVRNRFRSIADDSVFRVDRERDADAAVHHRVGRSMKLSELALPMIARSSNLATNLILDYLTPATVRKMLAEAGIQGVEVLRGVEDTVAFDRGLNNTVTAEGLTGIFRLSRNEQIFTEASRRRMLEIFLAQEFNAMIPALLPDGTQVAHKTGEISTCTHDAGLVLLPGRRPYAVAILFEHPPGIDHPQKTVAKVSRAIYEFITA